VGDIRSTLDANINGLTVGKGGGSVSDNTAFGVEAINATATGTSNTAIGWRSGRAITTGNFNTLLGSGTLQNGTTAGGNTAIGYNALNTATSGSENIAVGQNSLRLLTTGYWNVAVGRQAGNDVTTGYQNVFIGDNTGRGITTGNSNTIIGAGITGLSSSLSNTIILADGQGNQRLYINSNGEAMIGSTTDQGDFKLQVTGQQVIQGVLTAGSPGSLANVGVLEIKSSNQNALSAYGIKLNNTATGVAFITITADNSGTYGVPSQSLVYNSAHHLFYNTSGTRNVSLLSNGNVLIGTTTDGGQKFQVSGNALVSTSAYFATSSGAVGIGTTTVNSSALLDVRSTTKGFLPPTMTTAQRDAISSPVAGLIVFDTDVAKLSVYDGTNWQYLTY
jgi:hypothetical protein